MASIRKHLKGWQAQVARKGIRKSRVFNTKTEARDWAARQEHLILSGEMSTGGALGDLFNKYAREVSPKKRGARWEIVRLERLQKTDLAKVHLKNLTPGDFAQWRDLRLGEVSSSSVLRELQLISSVLSVARREWGLVKGNPLADVTRPKRAPPRDRRVSDDEIERLLAVAGTDLSKGTARAIHAFRFAVETAMRAGEILALRKKDINGNVARLHITKNGKPRDVPLSKAALALWEALPRDGFDLSSGSLDTLFRRVRGKAKIEGMTFHDSRAEATTRLAAKLDVLDLARVTGHQDLNMLIRVYYRKSAADIAGLLG